MTTTFLLFCVLIGVAAFLYSTVGHGGASGYLALMALFGFMPELMRPSALVLNVLVSSIALWYFYRQGHFSWALFWPFAAGSIPASFVGGLIEADVLVYKRLLGLLLIAAVVRMFVRIWRVEDGQWQVPLLPALVSGVAIGMLSGLIGIGGGIILSPLILWMGWGSMKQTAAVSALFILVNSVAGLAGMMQVGLNLDARMPWMVVFALAGGLAGSRMGARLLDTRRLRWFLALVLIIAAAKLLST
jgi:uncharacterized membrane protein YfcA